jgi:steroid delta-isomerase-like uncharacterized protein
VNENERVVQKIIEAVNRHDVDVEMEYMADDMTYVNDSVGTSDKNGFRDALVMFYAAFPDVKYQLNQMVSEGDTVVVELTVTGTHRGEFLGVPPTSKKINTHLAVVMEMQAGKVKRWRTYTDTATLMRQLEAIE